MNPSDKRLADEARSLKAVMNVGKNGLTAGAVALLRRELDQKRLIKVKILKGYLDASGKDRKEAAAEIASLGQARLVQLVGYAAVLYKI